MSSSSSVKVIWGDMAGCVWSVLIFLISPNWVSVDDERSANLNLPPKNGAFTESTRSCCRTAVLDTLPIPEQQQTLVQESSDALSGGTFCAPRSLKDIHTPSRQAYSKSRLQMKVIAKSTLKSKPVVCAQLCQLQNQFCVFCARFLAFLKKHDLSSPCQLFDPATSHR